MQPLVRQARELRQPRAQVGAVRIEALRLQHGVEDAVVRRGVRAAAGGPLPAEGIARKVGIEERVVEPARALEP